MSDAAFWDKIADRYAAQPVKDVSAYEKTLERTRSYLKPSDRVLETGCGTGSTALKMFDAVAHYTATDISPEMIRHAEAKRGDAPVTFLAAPTEAPVDGAPFDAVLAFNLFHLVDDLDGALAAVRDQIAPGGYLISKTVCLGEMFLGWRLILPIMRVIGVAPRVHILSISALEDRIRAAGFEIVETANYPASPPNRFVVARRL